MDAIYSSAITVEMTTATERGPSSDSYPSIQDRPVVSLASWRGFVGLLKLRLRRYWPGCEALMSQFFLCFASAEDNIIQSPYGGDLGAIVAAWRSASHASIILSACGASTPNRLRQAGEMKKAEAILLVSSGSEPLDGAGAFADAPC